MNKQFRLWAMCCSHVGTDLGFGRESLADAIRQSEQGGEEGGPAVRLGHRRRVSATTRGARPRRRTKRGASSSASLVSAPGIPASTSTPWWVTTTRPSKS